MLKRAHPHRRHPCQRPDLEAGRGPRVRAGAEGPGRGLRVRARLRRFSREDPAGTARAGEAFSGDTAAAPLLTVAAVTAPRCRSPAGSAARSGAVPRRGGARAQRGGAAAAPALFPGCRRAMEGFVDFTNRCQGRDQLFR